MKRDTRPTTGTGAAGYGDGGPEARDAAAPEAGAEAGQNPSRPPGLRRAATAGAVILRPKLRGDLRLVPEAPLPEDEDQGLPGALRIIDLRNGRQFEFTPQEHFLCREADGQSTTETLQALLEATTDSPLSLAQVGKFFRRLHVLGLLEPEQAPATPAPPPRFRAPGPRIVLVAQSDQDNSGETATPLPPAGAAGTDTAETAGTGDIAARGYDDTEDPGDAEVRQAESGRPESGRAESGRAEDDGIDVMPPEAGRPGSQRRPLPRFTSNRTDPYDDDFGMAGLFGPEPDAPQTARPGPANGAGGQRMRPNMGGMGGGMGMMGGGLMGGGMGMMGGGMGMMGAGMMAQPAAQSRSKGPVHLSLMDPQGLLRVLYVLFWPLKFVLWALLPLVLLAGFTMLQKVPELSRDLVIMFTTSRFLVTMAVGILIVNLGARLAQGVAIVAYGGRVHELGISLVLGLLPRFYIDDTSIAQMDRRGRLWAHGSPLLARLAAFSLGTLVWAMTRDQGGSLPVAALTVAKFGLIAFAFTAWPLLPADGMRWMATLFNEPRLMPKATMALRFALKKGRLPPNIAPSEVLPLTLFMAGVVLTFVILLGSALIIGATVLEVSLGGLGVVIFAGIVLVATLWLVASVRATRGLMAVPGVADRGLRGRASVVTEAPDPDAGAAAQGQRRMPGRARAAAQPVPESQALPNRARVVWMLLLVAVLITAFLPYTYETGGEVEISPAARGIASARTEGEIVEVLVTQGQVVRRGDVLARLSDWDQVSDLAVTEAQLAGAEARLAQIEAGAQPEEIELERAKVARAEAIATFKEAEVARARELSTSETISRVSLEKAEEDYATALADLEVARANLALVEGGATEEEREIAQADVQRLTAELDFRRDELERTRIVAPIDGRVVTPDLHLRTGDYLRPGDLLLEIEDVSEVTATIAIPEADVGLVAPGQTVRLKLRGNSAVEVQGVVESVAPIAEDAGYGRIVRATAVFPNPDGLIRSEMTGWAKIQGVELTVWEAYLRTILRFGQIDIWSWIP